MLLLLFVGLFLLRFADRAFLALLFHDPPRIVAVEQRKHPGGSPRVLDRPEGGKTADRQKQACDNVQCAGVGKSVQNGNQAQ